MEDGILRGPQPLDVPGLAGWLDGSRAPKWYVMFNGNIDNKPLDLGVPNLRQTKVYIIISVMCMYIYMYG